MHCSVVSTYLHTYEVCRYILLPRIVVRKANLIPTKPVGRQVCMDSVMGKKAVIVSPVIIAICIAIALPCQ